VKIDRATGGGEAALADRAEEVRRTMLRRQRSLSQRLAAVEKTVHARAPRERHRRDRERIDGLAASLRRAIAARQERVTAMLTEREREIHRAVELRMERLEQELRRRAAETESRSPLRVLARGYAVVTSEESGRVVRDPSDAPAGTPLRLQFQRGALRAVSAGADHGPGGGLSNGDN
jgi:exodeoxyribonuclease VII large subunit